MTHRRLLKLAAVAFCLLSMGTVGPEQCGPTYNPFFRFITPQFNLFTDAGELEVRLRVPGRMIPGTLVVKLIAPDTTETLLAPTLDGRHAEQILDLTEAGDYRIEADVKVSLLLYGTKSYSTFTTFEVADLDSPEECEQFNNTECLLPFPSARFQKSANTSTGVQLDIPAQGFPTLVGDALDPGPTNELDGFSPTVQILMHFPAGVDVEASGAARLQPPNCCGQPAGEPWIDTRTYTGRSLDPDSPTVLIDANTGERILHFAETDFHATGNLSRQALILRPGKSLTPGHRYIVAVRDLVDGNGDPIEAEAAFAALRDGRPTDIPGLAERRLDMEDVFLRLKLAGVYRWDLDLAFDFVVQSDDQLTRQMLAMRDLANAWLDDRFVELVPGNPSSQTFTVDSIEENDCNVPDTVLWRIVRGTYQSPLFLDGDLTLNSVQFMNVDANDIPVQNGVTNPDFTIGIPCNALTRDLVNDPLHPLTLGHGLFGRGESMVTGIPGLLASTNADLDYVAGATDWRGLSGLETTGTSGQPFGWMAHNIIGIGANALNNFPALPDRLRQGVSNTLVLTRMMKDGFFNNDPAFQVSGQGVFGGPTVESYYYGISLGGIMGLYTSALTPDIQAFDLDVPAMNFSFLLQRSTQFTLFQALLQAIGLTDPMETMLGLGLLHEVWVSAEPAGYATHVTSDRLAGSGPVPRVIMTAAWLDKQVANQATEVAARTLGLPNLTGSIQQGLQGIPDVAGPVDSALVIWDTGSFDILDPAQEPTIPPLANTIPSSVCDPHGARPGIPAGIDQLLLFLQPGGQAVNTCDGICDAGTDDERPGGVSEAELCDPLNP